MTKRIMTCALTGGAPIRGEAKVPVTPKQIAQSAIDAGKAGAAVVHIHVRDPQTGRSSMDLELYREVVGRIRDSGSKVLINLTTGTGGQFLPAQDDPSKAGPGTEMCTPEVRARHVAELKPDICSLDFCTMWFRTRAFINPPEHIERIAAIAREAGAMPELEVFDSGDIHLARSMQEKGVVAGPGFFQIVLGVSWGASATTETMIYLRSLLPPGAQWAAFGIGQHSFPMMAQSLLLGGHVRTGFEDNYYLGKGQLAQSNAALVEKGVSIMHALGFEPASPDEARLILGL